MTRGGTDAYQGQEVPPLVREAVELARRLSFEFSCLPQTGRLLRLLAAGVADGHIGETGTGGGVGLAWMATGAAPGARLISVEQDVERSQAARGLFAGHAGVTVLTGDASELFEHGPFDLLVLDGGPGSGKAGEAPVEPTRVLTPVGTLVVDDFTPTSSWPPLTPDGTLDAARLHWLEHPALFTTEVRLAPTMAVLIGRRRG